MAMRKEDSRKVTGICKSVLCKRLAASLVSLILVISLNSNSLIGFSSYVRADEITGASAPDVTAETTEELVPETSGGDYITTDNDNADEDPEAGDTVSADSDRTEETAEGSDVAESSEETTAENTEEAEAEETDIASQDDSEETVESCSEEKIDYSASTVSGIKVSAVCPTGAFAEDVSMKVKDIAREEAIDIAAGELASDNSVYGAVAVDITFISDDGIELEPLEGYEINVSITLPDICKLEGEEYVLLHQKEDGVEKIEDAVLTDTQADFTTDSFSVYVVTAVGEIDKDKVHDYLNFNGIIPLHDADEKYVPNTDWYPYLMRIGDEFTLRGYSDNQETINLDTAYTNGYSHLEVVSGSVKGPAFDTATQKYVYEATFRATSVGVARLKFADGSEANTFYVAVYDPDNSTRFDMLGDASLQQYNDPRNPYVISDWGQIEILSYDDFYVMDEYGNNVGQSSEALTSRGITPSGNVKIRSFTAYMKADSNTRTAKVCGAAVRVDNFDRKIFFKPLSISVRLDHADVEIANGGTFTSSSIYVENGKLYKRVDTFETYVENVNYCNLYQENGDPVNYYHKDGRKYDSSMTGYQTGDYGKDPSKKPSDSQYELTSKYKFIPDGKGGWKPEEDQSKWSDILYDVQDVDHVEIDLQLYLETPENGKSVLYVYDETAEGWDEIGTVDPPTDYTQVIEHVVFKLDRTAVLDAYNRCPLHNGMDFAVQTNHSKVQVQATKELINGNMSAGDFEFEIVEFAGTQDPKVVATSKNQADGTIVFDVMSFEEEGEHTYTIRETMNTGRTDASNIHFDTKEYTMKVILTKNEKGLLEADIELPNHSLSDVDFRFRNYVLMPLPNTGGTGTVIFYVVGGSLLLAGLGILAGKLFLSKKGKSNGEERSGEQDVSSPQ